ncbi:hypothetical protein AX16_003308 [Volvariella volvacea WC 439]|nr:hypothetical protein AX16_004814 [Volvariella volvacea WC 439]KAF8655004.1 hypothetical protein AX16_003308 [Volvariella volvacea WC 439]
MEAAQDIEIQDLHNIMSMGIAPYTSFRTLNLWLEPTDKPDTFTIRLHDEAHRPITLSRSNDLSRVQGVDEVTLKHTPELLAPSSRYLALHAMCCRISHFSGATEYFSQMQDEEDIYSKFTEDITARLRIQEPLRIVTLY